VPPTCVATARWRLLSFPRTLPAQKSGPRGSAIRRPPTGSPPSTAARSPSSATRSASRASTLGVGGSTRRATRCGNTVASAISLGYVASAARRRARWRSSRHQQQVRLLRHATPCRVRGGERGLRGWAGARASLRGPRCDALVTAPSWTPPVHWITFRKRAVIPHPPTAVQSFTPRRPAPFLPTNLPPAPCCRLAVGLAALSAADPDAGAADAGHVADRRGHGQPRDPQHPCP